MMNRRNVLYKYSPFNFFIVITSFFFFTFWFVFGIMYQSILCAILCGLVIILSLVGIIDGLTRFYMIDDKHIVKKGLFFEKQKTIEEIDYISCDLRWVPEIAIFFKSTNEKHWKIFNYKKSVVFITQFWNKPIEKNRKKPLKGNKFSDDNVIMFFTISILIHFLLVLLVLTVIKISSFTEFAVLAICYFAAITMNVMINHRVLYLKGDEIIKQRMFVKTKKKLKEISNITLIYKNGEPRKYCISFKDDKSRCWKINYKERAKIFVDSFWKGPVEIDSNKKPKRKEETITPTIELSTNMEGERKIRYINNSSIICTIGFTLLMPICIILYFSFKSTVDKAVPIFLIPAAIFGVLSYISYFLGMASIIVNDKEIISKSAFKKVKKSLNDIDYIELKKQGFKSYIIHFKEDNVTISLPYNVKIGEFIKSFWNKDIQNRE